MTEALSWKNVIQRKRAESLNLENQDLVRDLLIQHKVSATEFERILQILGRPPTKAELGVFSAMWSEHCSYKSSKVHLSRFPTVGPRVIVGPGENAGVVELDGDLCLAFKMESHNHPSYIEPYQGAATGVGGILRDVFCMGARPIASLNCLRFGERSHERTQYLVPRIIRGIGDYGNCVGIPTVGGSISFDASYNGNCLVNAMTVGIIQKNKIFKGYATGVGNLVVYVGSPTGRDGIHGASMASDVFAKTTSSSKTTVQVGDPFAEKLLMEATLEVLDKNLVIGIQDMGAAGLTSSAFEMAGRAGNGVFIDLDSVPKRCKNMAAYEILLSESQERMLMVIEPQKWQELQAVLLKWQLPHAIIGHVTDSARVQIVLGEILEVDIPVNPLTEGAPRYQKALAPAASRDPSSKALDRLQANLANDFPFASDLFRLMLRDVGSKSDVYEQFDRHVGTRTVFESSHGGAAVLWIKPIDEARNPYLGVAISAGCNERRVKNNPYIGAAEAVRNCAREIVVAGGKPIAVTDCLNFGNADDPQVMREFSDSVDGISLACTELETPVVSGNVSLYNATGSSSIYPTPMIGVVGVLDDVRRATPAVLLEFSDDVVVCQIAGREDVSLNLAASLAAKMSGISADEGSIGATCWRDEKSIAKTLENLRLHCDIKAARSISDGGLGIAVFKILTRAVASGFSIEIFTPDPISFFSEGGSRVLVCIPGYQQAKASRLVQDNDLTFSIVARIKSPTGIGRPPTDRQGKLGQLRAYFGEVDLGEYMKAFQDFLPNGTKQ